MNKWTIVGTMVLGAVALAVGLVAAGDRMGAMPSPGAPLNNPGGAPAAQGAGLPWDVRATPDGDSLVFDQPGRDGLRLSVRPGAAATLADVQARWPIEHQVAVVAAPGEDGALEAFVDPAQLGFVTGKLVIALHATPEQLKDMRDRAAKVEFMESTTRRFTLGVQDMATALKAPVRSISLIPQARLDAQTVTQRFGPPGLRITLGQGDQAVEHLLYPSQGIDVAVPAKGKSVIQYVAPAEFEARLLLPLQKQAQASAPQARP
ncbi:MAG: hypothetical protein RLZZ182_1525 [Pseudomonadota bacterium]